MPTAVKNLRVFLDRLRTRGELAEIHAEVDPRLEVASRVDITIVCNSLIAQGR